jgi:hypothetical protein
VSVGVTIDATPSSGATRVHGVVDVQAGSAAARPVAAVQAEVGVLGGASPPPPLLQAANDNTIKHAQASEQWSRIFESIPW